jgi:hypothetical protein
MLNHLPHDLNHLNLDINCILGQGSTHKQAFYSYIFLGKDCLRSQNIS